MPSGSQRQKNGDTLSLPALDALIKDTQYSSFNRVYSIDKKSVDQNLVILSRYEIIEHEQYKNKFVPPLHYEIVTALEDSGKEKTVEEFSWERPILHARVKIGENILNVINLHLKSKIPTDIKGQKVDEFTWKTASSWAEGSFLSSMKRVGQSLETRILIDKLFDETENP